MVWKLTIFFGLAWCCFGYEHHAISYQNLVQHNHPEYHGHHGELSHIGSHAPVHHEEYAWTYPAYEYSYNVDDPHTHDHKGQHEVRDGDTVKGMYWLIQPDGRKRTVTYYADKHHGFNAHVEYSDPHHPVPHHPVPHYPAPYYPAPHYPVPHYPVPHYPISHYPIPHDPIPHYPIPHYPIPQHPDPHNYGPIAPKEYHPDPKPYINEPVNHYPGHYDAWIHHKQPSAHSDNYNYQNNFKAHYEDHGHHNYNFKPHYDPNNYNYSH